jgi:hypothetical protein
VPDEADGLDELGAARACELGPEAEHRNVSLRDGSEPDVDGQSQFAPGVLGGNDAVHERFEGVRLRTVHERKVRLVRDLQRAEVLAVGPNQGADELDPAVELETRVSHAAENGMTKQSRAAVPVGEGQHGSLAARARVDEIDTAEDGSTEIVQCGANAVEVVGRADG